MVGAYTPVYEPLMNIWLPKVAAVQSRLLLYLNTGNKRAAAFEQIKSGPANPFCGATEVCMVWSESRARYHLAIRTMACCLRLANPDSAPALTTLPLVWQAFLCGHKR